MNRRLNTFSKERRNQMSNISRLLSQFQFFVNGCLIVIKSPYNFLYAFRLSGDRNAWACVTSSDYTIIHSVSFQMVLFDSSRPNFDYFHWFSLLVQEPFWRLTENIAIFPLSSKTRVWFYL